MTALEYQPPSLATLPPIERATGDLFTHLMGVIQHRIDNHPRSLQKRIGPSEIGTPCDRQLAYKLAGVPESRDSDKWKATVGTAIHSWLEQAFVADCHGKHPAPWLVENKVTTAHIGEDEIDGSTDLYARPWAAVVDWKTCSPSVLKTRKKEGPTPSQEVQLHDYGRGWAARGLPVETVHLVYLPRNGELREAVHWSAPFDPSIAERAYERANRISTLVTALGIAPALALTKADGTPAIGTVDAPCVHCDWYLPGSRDLSRGCPGDPNRDTRTRDSAGRGIVIEQEN